MDVCFRLKSVVLIIRARISYEGSAQLLCVMLWTGAREVGPGPRKTAADRDEAWKTANGDQHGVAVQPRRSCKLVLCSYLYFLRVSSKTRFSCVLQLVRSMTHGEGNDEPVETEKSLKMKLCLYLESLFGAMEVGVPV